MFITELNKDYSKTLDLYLKEETTGVGEGLFSIKIRNNIIEYNYEMIDISTGVELVQFQNIDLYKSGLVKNEINKFKDSIEKLANKFNDISIKINAKLINKANRFNWESLIFAENTPVIEIETENTYIDISIQGSNYVFSEYYPHFNKLSCKEIEMLLSDEVDIRNDDSVNIEEDNWFQLTRYNINHQKVIGDVKMNIFNGSMFDGELGNDCFIGKNKSKTTINEIIQFLSKYL